MIKREQLPELRSFAHTEKTLHLRADDEFASLVVPNGNALAPCHRWFKYKEAFSSELLGHVLRNLIPAGRSSGTIRMLDPYCGVGTSLLSAQLCNSRIESLGIECNPFSAFVAKTKLAWHRMDPAAVRDIASTFLAKTPLGSVALPRLSSITARRCITYHMARQVMLCREALEALPATAERDGLMLGLASVIEPVSRVRRDGRALRIVDKQRIVFRDILAERWETIASDVELLQRLHPTPSSAEIRIGDGRRPDSTGVEDGSIDLILTSPPYPNNIDYNEVYKLELWFLGHANTANEFLTLRRETFRSHPTCSPMDGDGVTIDAGFVAIMKTGPFANLMGAVVRRVSELEKTHPRGRSKVLLGYAYDTWRGLQAHFRALRPGGRAVYVVGNSLHGGVEKPYLVPTDLMLATLAQNVGFDVVEVIIARGLKRRLAGNHFLRDSVVVLRKNQ